MTSGAPIAPLADRNAPVRIAAATACLVGAQFLHWHVIDQHAQEWPASGTFFFLLALGEGALAILVVTRLRPWVATAAIISSAAPVMIWAWDRAIGLPFGPTKGVRGTIGRSDVMCVVFELLTIAALWPFRRGTDHKGRPARIDAIGRIVIGTTCAYVAAFAMWAMLGDQRTAHHATSSTKATINSPSSVPANDAPLNSFAANVAPRSPSP